MRYFKKVTCVLFGFSTLFFTACGDSSSVFIEEDLLIAESSSAQAGLPENNSPVIFTEIDPINTVYDDHEGGDAGWVELFNKTDTAINLSGYALTDSPDNLKKWIFGNAILPPKSHLLVFLSGKDYKDFVVPSDSVSLVGPGCWAWTDEDSDPPGYSTLDFLPGKTTACFNENGARYFGATMHYGENKELGWHSIALFVGTKSANKNSYIDISNATELLLTGYITKDRILQLNLAQPDLSDWMGWGETIVGTGDSTTTYQIPLPTGTKFPDLSKIYGTRFSPETNELQPLGLKVTSFIARNRGHEPHSNFKANKNGGNLYLVDKENVIADSISYPSMPTGKSWSLGTNTNGISAWGFALPTPYGTTATSVSETQAKISNKNFPPSGFYSSPFTVSFTESENVRCATGGYEPTESSEVLTSMQISNTTVLRCASFLPNAIRSDIESRTYVFETQPLTPVVFLTGDPKSLFDPDSGIYMEGPNAQAASPHFGANYWLDKEIPIFVDFFENNIKTPAFSKNAGLKIFGNYSRANKKKSVAVTFREKYGDKRLDYSLFPQFPHLKKFKVFILRNNGGNYGADYIHDRLASSATEGLGLDYQHGRGAVVYYNGEYYGIHNIRERSTEYYFETNYGMDPDAIDLLKAGNEVTAGYSTDYVAMMDWLESNHLNTNENYEKIAEQVDVENFMNYVQTELYVDNRDWPANNLKKWRCTNPKTKWKWFLYDLDFGFGNGYSEYKNNIFEYATNAEGPDYPNGPASTLLLRRLLENENFKMAFINRMSVLLSMNFEKTRMLSLISSMMAEIQSEIPKDQQRWKLNSAYMNNRLASIKKFVGERQDILLAEMQDFFNLGEQTNVNLSVEGSGKILVHNLPIDRTSMTIPFFKGTPIVLTAQANGGSVFTGWSDGEIANSRTILPEEASFLKAVFK